jgi:hypothetical protein
MVGALHPKLNSLIRAANLEIDLELEQMADFTELVAKVEKIRGTAESTKTFIQGLKARIEELAAGMNDTEDNAAIMALAADLGNVESSLATAIQANPEPAPAG